MKGKLVQTFDFNYIDTCNMILEKQDPETKSTLEEKWEWGNEKKITHFRFMSKSYPEYLCQVQN